MNFKEKFTYKFLRFLSRHLNSIDDNRRSLYANMLAGFVYKFIPIRKQVALANIQISFPNRDIKWAKKELKRSYRIVIKNFIDFLSIPAVIQASNFTIKNLDVLDNGAQVEIFEKQTLSEVKERLHHLSNKINKVIDKILSHEKG